MVGAAIDGRGGAQRGGTDGRIAIGGGEEEQGDRAGVTRSANGNWISRSTHPALYECESWRCPYNLT